jgi:signal transduction histidine kinase
VGHVAHALSNYITVTAATVEMLKLALRDHPDRDVIVWIEGVGHAADLMMHSVNRLVSMSTPADFPLRVERVNLVVLMERVCDYYRRRPGAEQLQITCSAVGPVALAVGDRVAIAVVADSLLANAVKASQPSGSIRVQVMAEPGHVVCSVRHAGEGLTAEEQRRAFAEYGLSIASEFVRRMGGDLWRESEPGQGTRFSFRLPAAD